MAKYLGVAPWELAGQPVWWYHKARDKMIAEWEAVHPPEGQDQKQGMKR